MTENPNTNCLEGWQCPDCGSFGPFDVDAISTFRMSDDGTEWHDGAEFDIGSHAQCPGCKYSGTVETFTGVRKKYSVLLLYPDYLDSGTGRETYFEFTEAHSPEDAVEKVQRVAYHAYGNESCEDPEDFLPLAVFEGHHDMLLGITDYS